MRDLQGTSRLAASLGGLVGHELERTPLALFQWNDFGEILPDYALRVHGYTAPFPVGQYFVVQRLLAPDTMLTSVGEIPQDEGLPDVSTTVPATGMSTEEASGHSHGITPHDHGVHAHPPHVHQVLRQGVFRKLLPGDHVVVAWANQVDPVVIDRYSIMEPPGP